MDKTTEGSAPVTAPTAEPKVSTPEAAPAAPSSSLTAQQEFEKSVREAKSPAELRAATEKMRNFNKAPVNADSKQAAAATEEGKPAEAKKADETPAAEETPAEPATEEPAPDAEAPAEPAEETEAEEDEEADGPIEPTTSKKPRFRLSEDDQVGRLAAAYKQRNRDWTLEQALVAAKKQLGIKTEAEPPAAADTKPKPNADLPQSVDEVDSATARLEEERTKATTDLRFEDVDKIDRQLRRLDRHRGDLVRQGEQQRVQEQVKYDSTFDASHSQAAELYEFVGDPKSPGYARMLEIEASMKATNDPTYYDPDKPRIIAQMVGRELRIAPKKKGAPAPAKAAAPAAPAAPAAKKGILPSGGSRTTPAAPAAKPADTAKFEGIRSMADLRKVQKELGIAG